MEKYGLDVKSVENLSHHYHRSVEEWLKNFGSIDSGRATSPGHINRQVPAAGVLEHCVIPPRACGEFFRGTDQQGAGDGFA